MKHLGDIQLFEDKHIRTLWDADQEKWYISIVDVVAILTVSIDAGAYWRKLNKD
jgi:general stress protein 26